MSDKPSIPQVRQRIDQIDDTILELLKERLDCARTIGLLKDETSRAKWDPQRELEIYERLKANNNDVFPYKALRSIFHEIITTCRLSQRKAIVSYLGPEATFSHLAAVKYFGQSADYRAMESIAEVFEEVEKERVQYGIVPVENSIEGAVTYSLDAFLKYKVQICGEIQLAISHNLVCRSGNIEDIQTVASHSQPLAQCRDWLRKNLPRIPTLDVFSTGTAAQMAANNPNIGAIASSLAVSTYGLQVVVRGIEDYQGNTTRFLVIGRESFPSSGHDRTSLLVFIRDRPGALYGVLEPLARRGISMNRIESRPAHGHLWQYAFFIDVAGHRDESPLKDALDEIAEQGDEVRVLGSYPVAIL